MGIKIGSLVIDLEGITVSPEEVELLRHPLVGGVILFTRNYENLTQLKELCRTIRAARQEPLIIMVDQEGGRVQRFRQGFYSHPPLAMLGARFDKDRALALQLAQTAGWLMASEILAAGLDLSLAPVVDINTGLSTVIGDRSFHADPQAVFRLAYAYIQGMQEAGMTATLKHFPGHGSVMADSHHDTPVDTRELKVILEVDLAPFQQLIHAGVHAVMAAHIIFPQVDALQVSFSRVWLQDILRKRLGFNGVIISDALDMQGANISDHYADRVLAAREAGCDFTLICNNRSGVIEALDRIPHAAHMLDENKWRVMQANFSLQGDRDERTLKVQKFLHAHMERQDGIS